MRNPRIKTAFLLGVALLGGCVATPLRLEEAVVAPQRAVTAAAAAQRAAAFQRALAGLPLRGVGVSLGAYRNVEVPASAVIERVRMLGFNRLYCHVSSELELDEPLRALLAAAGAAKIPAELVVRQGDFFRRPRGNALLRTLRTEYPTLPELAGKIVDFNAALPPADRLSGVTAVFEPHVFTAVNGANTIPGLCYIWSDKTFGPGLDNDRLVDLSLRLFRQTADRLAPLPLTVAVPDFYHEWAVAGRLTKGNIRDFAGFAGVMLISSGNKPTQIVAGVADELKIMKNLSVGIQVADHSSVRTGALRRRDWNDLVRALGFFRDSVRALGCSGVVLRPLGELDFMLYEQD